MSSSEGEPQYPYMMRRIYLCGHPKEAIWVEKEPSGQIIHYIVQGYEKKPNGLDPPEYTLEKCRGCATDKKRQKARETALVQGMPRCRSGQRDGFMAALHRHRAVNEAEMEPRIRVAKEAAQERLKTGWFLWPWPPDRTLGLHVYNQSKEKAEADARRKEKEKAKEKDEAIYAAEKAKYVPVVHHAKLEEGLQVRGATVRHPNGIAKYSRAERRHVTQAWLAGRRAQLEAELQHREEELEKRAKDVEIERKIRELEHAQKALEPELDPRAQETENPIPTPEQDKFLQIAEGSQRGILGTLGRIRGQMPQFKNRKFRQSDASGNTQSSDGGSRRSDDMSRRSGTPRGSVEVADRRTRWRLLGRNSGVTTQSADPLRRTQSRKSAGTWSSDKIGYGRTDWE